MPTARASAEGASSDAPSGASGERLLAEIAQLRAEVARLEARLSEAQSLADRDALTPAFNRRAFMRELSRALADRSRYGSAAALIYFDLDGLKGINDRYGHAVGDAALRATAERIGREIRQSDVLGRLGGDEFAVILAKADAARAVAKAETLAAVVAREPLAFPGGTTPLSLSWGVAEISADADPEALVAAADAAMYARKRGGR